MIGLCVFYLILGLKLYTLLIHVKTNLMSSIQRYLLSSIYCNNLNDDDVNIKQTISFLSDKIGFDASFIRDTLVGLEREGLVTTNFGSSKLVNPINRNNEIHRLTELGRSKIRVVLVGGVFDLLHSGHIHTLRAAKALGDVLVVVVATDSTVSNIKKNRKIYHDEKSRLELVSSIQFVDKAIVGRKRSIYETVEFVKPDIIALGYDQFHDENVMKKNCLDRGINLEVVRLSSPVPQLKSSVIKSELGTSFYDL